MSAKRKSPKSHGRSLKSERASRKSSYTTRSSLCETQAVHRLTMAIQSAFEVTAFGCDIRVESSCPEAGAILERYVFPSLPRSATPSRQPHLLIGIARVSDQIQLHANHAAVASAGAAEKLVPDLIRVLDDAIIRQLSGMRAIHAGAVLWNGSAVLLPGATHSGKTSLVVELLKRGAAYFSDEYALIDSDGRVHPYPRPLLLRDASPEPIPTLPSEWNAAVGDGPAMVGWILSLEYHPSSAFSLRPVSQGETLLTLLQNTPHILAESPDLIEVFQRAVADTACYSGRRPHAPHAVDQLLKLIGNPA